MQRPRITLRRSPSAGWVPAERARQAPPALSVSQGGFTLVELIAAVALLIILMGILFVVFGEAGKTVSIGQTRVARYAAVRAFFRLLEDDLDNAFLMRDEDGSSYGLAGQNGADPAFLSPAPDGDSDRLTLVRLRQNYAIPISYDPLNPPRPGFVKLCYLRRTYDRAQELVPERRNVLFRVADENTGTWPPASTWPPPWGQPYVFPNGFLAFAVPDPAVLANYAYFRKYIVALDVSDLQFRYLKVSGPTSAPTWQDTWKPGTAVGEDAYDPDGPGPLLARPALPIEVEVSIRLGPDANQQEIDPNTKEVIHETFTQLIHLPLAP